jgi:O-antigen ligase
VSRLAGALRGIGAEAIGLVADDWWLPLGVAIILALGWWLVAHGSGSAAVALLVVALAGFLLCVTVLDGRARLRRRAARGGLDSTAGGRVPERDR